MLPIYALLLKARTMDHPQVANTPTIPAPSSQVESTLRRNKASRACKECRRKKVSNLGQEGTCITYSLVVQ